jgi:hypothetical protein
VDNAYAYVLPETNEQFGGYARRCGLSSQSDLLKLLIHRELKLRRLPSERALQSGSRQSPARGRKKITARLEPELGKSFEQHLQQLGLSTSCAASLLVQNELEERWLEAAIEWKQAQ